MPYALVVIGLILIVTGVRDTHAALGSQIKSDLTGDASFTRYALAIFAVGALGYIDKLRTASTAFMALIIISLVLSNRGVFNKLSEAIDAGPEAPPEGSTGTPSGPRASIMPPGMTKHLDWSNLLQAPTLELFGKRIF